MVNKLLIFSVGGVLGLWDGKITNSSSNLADKQIDTENRRDANDGILNAKAHIATVETLFHNKFFEIPSYQREFSWGAPQVDALVADLIESFQARDCYNETPQYFLGAIVTQVRQLNDLGEVDVADKLVDGQQRFTSLMIMLAVLSKHLQKQAEINFDDGLSISALEGLLQLFYREDDEHFVLDVTGYNYYLRQLMGGAGVLPQRLLGQPPFRSSALQNFVKAFEIFERRILEEIVRVDKTDENGGYTENSCLV